jgi:hypothetical protein
MPRLLPHLLVSGYLGVVLIGTFAVAAEPDKEVAHQFKFTITANLEMDVQGKKQKVVGDTEANYKWTRNSRERILSFNSVSVKVNVDGKQMMNTFMSRAKVTNTADGKTDTVPVENAPEQLKTMLEDSFGVPICKLKLDEKGKEVKRTVVAGPGAKDFIDNGMIANALLFHPPVVRDQDEWQAAAEVSMGNGGYARGKLTYKKEDTGKGGESFKVSGTLTNDGFKKLGTQLTIRKVNYIVRGKQT